MLDKFPDTVKPVVWWPEQLNHKQPQQSHTTTDDEEKKNNGWDDKLEEEMVGIQSVLRRKDLMEYVRLCKLVLKLNKILAVSGALLASMTTVGTALIGSASHESWPVVVCVLGGALAATVNRVEHGGKVGMVVEMYRNCAGFYSHLEKEIDANLRQGSAEDREDGEVFEMKTALQLGRSLTELKRVASSYSGRDGEDGEEFAGKLF